MKIYTKTGDQGKTSLLSGKKVVKTNLLLEAYGTVDELNSVIGMVLSNLSILKPQANLSQYCDEMASWLEKVQNQLFRIGSHLACDSEKLRARLPELNEDFISFLETTIDKCDESLPELKNFILPNGSRVCTHLHLARSVCRRAERRAVACSEKHEVSPLVIIGLNRLSDFLFVLARYANFREGHHDKVWEK